MSKTFPLLFCGPVPEPGAAPAGGYEASNSRTIAALAAAGRPVQVLPYPQPRGGALSKLAGYWRGFGALLAALGRQPAGGVLHVTGLYKQFVIPELLLLRRARRRGLATIYDVRAGSMLKHYARLGPLYRWLFRATLRSADLVMIEGQEYAPFIEQHTGGAPFYLPNHVGLAEVPAPARAASGPPRLVYVGRVTVEKGIETALDAARLLAAQGLRFEVAVAGPGDAALMARLRQDHADLPVEWLGSLRADEVLAQFGRAHFFVFPTRHGGEGHSNALTEAMAMGCVPVASENGFNRSVIADAGRVLPLQADAAAYAAVLRELWTSGQWAGLSARAAQRAREQFSTEQVVARLLAAYAGLSERKK